MLHQLMTVLLFGTLFDSVQGGPIAYALCQTGCSVLVVACYTGAGLRFGLLPPPLHLREQKERTDDVSPR